MKGSLSPEEQVKTLRQKNDRLWDLINYQAAEIKSLKEQLIQKSEDKYHASKENSENRNVNDASYKKSMDNQQKVSRDSNGAACENCRKKECRFDDYMFDGISKWRYGHGACGPNPNTDCHCKCHQKRQQQALLGNAQTSPSQTSEKCDHQWHCLKHGYSVKVGEGCYVKGYGFGICCQVGQQHGTYYYCCVQCKFCCQRKAKGSSWPEFEVKQRVD